MIFNYLKLNEDFNNERKKSPLYTLFNDYCVNVFSKRSHTLLSPSVTRKIFLIFFQWLSFVTDTHKIQT